ncbi:unnamed protein product [Schistosoma curassoni]|uniref:FBA_1 domain-containing protein n=1 Tax=Schistosoma curassoni TaxID=6186 RepID=A0A183JNB2_9TREM|nr:unnamed protein product [Schistosoma curassoni]
MGCRVTLPNGEHQLRSDVSFRCGSQSIHHRGCSVFESLPLDVITYFPSEPMHMMYVGFTKKLISLWKDLAVNRLNGMNQSIFSFISLALELCTNHTTCDFQMKCRSLYEVSVWKTTECRAVKRKFNDYLCNFEELDVAEVEAGFALVDFPVVNISTGNFSLIAKQVPI